MKVTAGAASATAGASCAPCSTTGAGAVQVTVGREPMSLIAGDSVHRKFLSFGRVCVCGQGKGKRRRREGRGGLSIWTTPNF